MWNALSNEERQVLTGIYDQWDEYYGDDVAFSFQAISSISEVDVALIPHVCRLLRARGFLEYWSGLWTEEGRPAGAGYSITKAGRKLVQSVSVRAA